MVKKMNKKLFKLIIFVIVVISTLSLSSCASKKDESKFKVVTTIFSEYDWTLNVLGEMKDAVSVKMLLDSGADLHSYQPTVDDIASISKCDLFIYVGGESDDWVKSALDNVINKDMIVINLLEVLGDKAKEEQLVEGMQAESEEEDNEDVEYDEHVWLSLKNAQIFVNEIASALGKIDKENTSLYLENAASYNAKLSNLDAQFEQVVKNSNRDTILFGDRFPFLYLVEDYGLKYFAAFLGCSAETEASFETMAFLIDKTNELDLDVILIIESSDGSIAKTIKENSNKKNQQILVMDSLQSATVKEYNSGRTYLKVMQNNLEVLAEALK